MIFPEWLSLTRIKYKTSGTLPFESNTRPLVHFHSNQWRIYVAEFLQILSPSLPMFVVEFILTTMLLTKFNMKIKNPKIFYIKIIQIMVLQ